MNIDEKYEKLLEHFYNISKVPRNSTEEKKIAEYLCKFASERNLEYRTDNLYNVLIKKKASSGYENRKPIIFQAHTDMVCEKTVDSIHDFAKDPIEIINDGVVLKAKDTTLGADDGIGVAMCLLLLSDDELFHPDIYCLFTTQEEIGMDGAKYFDYSGINANYLINIDGEEENTAIVGCAGGARLNYEKKVILEETDKNFYELIISGLRGGHSGVDIDKGRKNSNCLCAEILRNIEDVQINQFIGGNKDNAIPNLTKVVFATNIRKEKIEEIVNNIIKENVFIEDDKNIKIELNEIKTHMKIYSREITEEIIYLLLNLKQGVIEYSKDKEGLVETSGNIGIVNIINGNISIKELVRSSDDNKRREIQRINNEITGSRNYKIEIQSEYPGWKYKPNSNLENVYISAYMDTHDGNEPKIEAIHAGVECGMIYEKMPNLELISIGPDIVDVHTTNESLYLDSCKKILKTIFAMIEKLD